MIITMMLAVFTCELNIMATIYLDFAIYFVLMSLVVRKEINGMCLNNYFTVLLSNQSVWFCKKQKQCHYQKRCGVLDVPTHDFVGLNIHTVDTEFTVTKFHSYPEFHFLRYIFSQEGFNSVIS